MYNSCHHGAGHSGTDPVWRFETRDYELVYDRTIGHYTDVTPSILSRDFVKRYRDFIARQKSQVWHAVSHTATLPHKRELTIQRSPHFRDKVAQNRSYTLL